MNQENKEITIMNPITIHNRQNTASCQGPDDFSMHPRIFLDLTKTGKAICPYCSRLFICEKE